MNTQTKSVTAAIRCAVFGKGEETVFVRLPLDEASALAYEYTQSHQLDFWGSMSFCDGHIEVRCENTQEAAFGLVAATVPFARLVLSRFKELPGGAERLRRLRITEDWQVLTEFDRVELIRSAFPLHGNGGGAMTVAGHTTRSNLC
jgi:hypothetical protein